MRSAFAIPLLAAVLGGGVTAAVLIGTDAVGDEPLNSGPDLPI